MKHLLILLAILGACSNPINLPEDKPKENVITLVNQGGICTVVLRKLDKNMHDNEWTEIYEFGRELELKLESGYYCFSLEKRDWENAPKYLIREATCGYNYEFPTRILVDTVKMYD